MGAPVYVNGKFCAQRTTGVQRFARGVLHALDEHPAAAGWTLLCPPGCEPPVLRRIQVTRVGGRSPSLHFWEQVILPWAAREGLLISLAGSAPAWPRTQAVVVHDAAVFDQPGAYTPAFRTWYRFLFRRLARRARTLCTVSDFSRARLAAHLKLDPARISVLRPGSDAVPPPCEAAGALPVHRPYVLAVASVNPAKNLAALVRAFASRADRDLALVIVGGRNDKVFAAAPALAHDPAVLDAGPVSDEVLQALYTHAVALVFPSLYEGFGLPALEAMAAGCAVVAARIPALEEVCADAALYVDPEDDASITAAIDRIARDRRLREQLRLAGRRRAATFRWADTAASLVAALALEGARA